MPKRKTTSAPTPCKLRLGPCQNTVQGKITAGHCVHEVEAVYSTITGPVSEYRGLRTGHQIFRMVDEHAIDLSDQPPDRNLDHFLLQQDANTTKIQKKYKKGPKPEPDPTPPGGAPLPAPVAPARVTMIGGRRGYGAQNKSRMRAYDRIDGEHGMGIRNGVWKGTFGLGASMKEARRRLYGDYDESGFQACQLRGINPQNTISVGTGEVNVTAARTRFEALLTIWTTAIQQFEYFDIPVDVQNVGVVNMTGSAGVGCAIDLTALCELLERDKYEHNTEATYDVEFFPNLVYKSNDQKLAFGISSRGFVNVVGVKSEAHMNYVEHVIIPRIRAAVAELHARNPETTKPLPPDERPEPVPSEVVEEYEMDREELYAGMTD